MSEYKKQHYTARSYLKGFSPAYQKNGFPEWEKNNIYYFSINDKIIDKTTVNNIAYRDYYYSFQDQKGIIDNSIEHNFSLIENRFIKLRSKIESNISELMFQNTTHDFTSDDKIDLCKFIIIHLLRTPKIVDTIYDGFSKHEIDIAKRYNIKEDWKYSRILALEVIVKLLNGKHYDFLNELLKFKIQCYFVPRRYGNFITSDNPVLLYNSNTSIPAGLKYDSTHIIFPINKYCYINMSREFTSECFVKIEEMAHVFSLNHSIYQNAYNQVYGPSHEDLIKLQNIKKTENSISRVQKYIESNT